MTSKIIDAGEPSEGIRSSTLVLRASETSNGLDPGEDYLGVDKGTRSCISMLSKPKPARENLLVAVGRNICE
jgi:hypothetical protein